MSLEENVPSAHAKLAKRIKVRMHVGLNEINSGVNECVMVLSQLHGKSWWQGERLPVIAGGIVNKFCGRARAVYSVLLEMNGREDVNNTLRIICFGHDRARR